MAQEPATLIQPPESPPEEPRSLSVAPEKVEETEIKPGPETAAPEGVEAGAETPWWQSPASEDDLRSHETVSSWLEDAKREGQSEAQRRLQPIEEQRRAATRQQAANTETIKEQLDGMARDLGRLARVARENSTAPDQDDLVEFLDERRKVLGQAAATFEEDGRWKGAKDIIFDISQELQNPALLEEFGSRIDALRDGVADVSWRKDFIERIADHAVQKAVKPKDAEIAKLKAQVEQMKGTVRAAEGPSNLPGAPAGGNVNLNQARRDYADGRMTTAEAQKLGIV